MSKCFAKGGPFFWPATCPDNGLVWILRGSQDKPLSSLRVMVGMDLGDQMLFVLFRLCSLGGQEKSNQQTCSPPSKTYQVTYTAKEKNRNKLCYPRYGSGMYF